MVDIVEFPELPLPANNPQIANRWVIDHWTKWGRQAVMVKCDLCGKEWPTRAIFLCDHPDCKFK